MAINNHSKNEGINSSHRQVNVQVIMAINNHSKNEGINSSHRSF